MKKLVLPVLFVLISTFFITYKLIDVREKFINNSEKIHATSISIAENMFSKKEPIGLDKIKELIFYNNGQDLALGVIDALMYLIVFFVVVINFLLILYAREISKVRRLSEQN